VQSGRALDKGSVTKEEAQRASQWLALLDRFDEMAWGRDVVAYWLEKPSTAEHPFFAAQAFAYLTRPIGRAELGFRRRSEDDFDRGLRPTVAIRADRFGLQQIWEGLFKPRLEVFAPHLAPLILDHLHQAHLLVRSQGLASETFDPLSYFRSAIEPHEQNKHDPHEAFGILIDAGRDVLDWFIEHRPAKALQIIEAWLGVDAPLVQRLCIYGLARHPGLTPNRKIRRVVDEHWLERWQLRHEVFLLLQKSYKGATQPTRKRLLRAARRAYFSRERVPGDPNEDARAKAYELFRLLIWLAQQDPGCPLVANELQKTRERFPDFTTPEYPDFSHWSYGVQSVKVVSHLPADELVKLEPEAWVAQFTEATKRRADPRSFEDPTTGFLEETEKATQQDFEWSLKLAEHLARSDQWEHPGWHYLFRSWASEALDPVKWRRVLALLEVHPELFRHEMEIAELLERRVANRDFPATEEIVLEALPTATTLWSALKPEPAEDTKVSAWVQRSLNRPGGKLGLFAMHGLSRVWSEQKEHWNGIPESFRPLLEAMVHADRDSSPLGRVIICGFLHFMFAIDASWTQEKLFPRFDWSRDPDIAVQAWHGFLAWGRPTRELMAAFMPLVEQTFEHLSLLCDARERFPERLADIAYSSPTNPLAASWIRHFLRRAEAEDLEKWAVSLGSILGDIDPAERRGLWNSWLRDYWALRHEIGVLIADGEWAAMIHWALHLGEFLPEVMGLLQRRAAVRRSGDILYYRLRKQDGLFDHPTALVDLLMYLLSAEDRLYHDCDYLGEIFRRLFDAGVPAEKLQALANRLAELGCTNASQLAALLA
jgi:uncharacterized protein DUF4020